MKRDPVTLPEIRKRLKRLTGPQLMARWVAVVIGFTVWLCAVVWLVKAIISML